MLAYEAGRHGGRPFVERYGRWLLLTTHDVDRAERFFGRYGGAAVIVGRLLPGIRSFIALPAGIARMPLVRFHLYTFVVSWPWCFALAYIGMMLGRSWNSDPRLSPLSPAKVVTGLDCKTNSSSPLKVHSTSWGN